jgi:hypothetical protein
VVGGGLVGGAVVGGGLVGGTLELSPKNEIAYPAMPVSGSTCPAPAMLYASTSTVPELLS